MGTSKSNMGPTGKNPLIPDWAQGDNRSDQNNNEEGGDHSQENKENPVEQNEKVEPKISWKSPKEHIGKYSESRDKSSLKKAGQNYVKALGGSKGALKSSKTGIKSVSKLGGFLSDFSNSGFDRALDNIGLGDFIGSSIEEVIPHIIDALSPLNFDADSNSSRIAIKEAIEELMIEIELKTDGTTSDLESISPQLIDQTLLISVEAYIYSRCLHEIGVKIEEKALTESEACTIEKDVKDYIKECVKYDFKDYDLKAIGFNSQKGKELVENIFEEAYIIIENGK